MSSAPSGHHLAAILPSKGARLEVTHRPTLTPGPNELLIDVRSIALNPIDHRQRDTGIFLTDYPAILCSDIAGTIISTGSSVDVELFKPGTKVAAFASCFYDAGALGHGALQTRVIVPATNAVPLPYGMSFNEASLLPMAVETTWAGWYSIGLARDTKYTAADKKGMLVWGGASSVGSAVVQVAKLMGFVVYATASGKHHEYLKKLGASTVFDYKNEDVLEQIIKAAKEDGVTIQIGYDAVPGALEQCIEVLKELKGEGTAKLASAPRLPEDFSEVDGVEVKFVRAPVDAKERMEHFHFVFNIWLKEKLATGEFVPSPKVRVIEGGLEAANEGLDELRKGVSGVKLVLEV
jgi:NADPH:quinone reductase-like Zn-dependent oxidoreductase